MKYVKLSIVTFFIFIFFSCQSNQGVIAPVPEYQTVTYNEEKNIVENDETYLFIRLYNPYYNNPLCIENSLKNLINLVEVNDIVASHAAIGFSLEDGFWGLTLSKGNGVNQNLNMEYCTNTTDNLYMKKCNEEKSLQTTYALRVETREFNDAKDLVEKYVNDPKMKYSVKINFQILGFELKRKFFTPKEKRNIKTMEVRKRPLVNEPNEKDFQCASFVAYILINSVDDVRDFFEKQGLDYNEFIPSDLAEIPGVQELFTSSWEDYNKAAEQFIWEYQQGMHTYTEGKDISFNCDKKTTKYT